MKYKTLIGMISVLSIITCNTCFAAETAQKIAVIDTQKVVAASAQVKAIKKAQDTKNNEIASFIKTAQADINKQKTEEGKKKLSEKYEKQLREKKEANIKDYMTKLQDADKNITAKIGKIATEKGYTVVLPKTAVVFGGDDITEEVIKAVK